MLLSTVATPTQAATGLIKAKGHYFVDEAGAPFIVIGHNEGIYWPPAFRQLYLSSFERGCKSLEDYFRYLHESGVNTIRLFAEYPHKGLYMYDGQGRWLEENWKKLDTVFYFADRFDIYILLGPWDPFWTARTWDECPLNEKNGGPLKSKEEFFTSPETRRFQELYLKRLVERYGGRRNLLAWEILNEADLWWDPKPITVRNWLEHFVPLMRRWEKERWGGNHMIAISAARGNPLPVWRDLIYKNSLLDFVSTHMYYTDVANPKDAQDVANEIREGMKFQFIQMADKRKPYLETESGPIDSFVKFDTGPVELKLDEHCYHHTIWASLASGAAGQAMRWPYRVPYHTLTRTMHRYQLIQSTFVKRFPFKDFLPVQLDGSVEIRQDKRTVVAAMGDSRRAMVALLRDDFPAQVSVNRPMTEEEIIIHYPFEAGRYHLLVMETQTGQWLADQYITNSGGDFKLKIPTRLTSLAIALFREDATAPSPTMAPVPLTFSVHDGEERIRDAHAWLINGLLGKVTLSPDKSGLLKADLPAGPYIARVFKPNYLPVELPLVVNRSPIEMNVNLVKEKTYLAGRDQVIWTEDFTDKKSFERRWHTSRIAGEKDGDYHLAGGELTIHNPVGSRFGLMSSDIGGASDGAFYVEAQLNHFSGYNALLSIYGGDGGFDHFVEMELSGQVFNLWTPVYTLSQEQLPRQVDAPMVLRVEVSAPDDKGCRDVRAYETGRLTHEIKKVPDLGKGHPLHVFLYGWDSTTVWDWVVVGKLNSK